MAVSSIGWVIWRTRDGRVIREDARKPSGNVTNNNDGTYTRTIVHNDTFSWWEIPKFTHSGKKAFTKAPSSRSWSQSGFAFFNDFAKQGIAQSAVSSINNSSSSRSTNSFTNPSYNSTIDRSSSQSWSNVSSIWEDYSDITWDLDDDLIRKTFIHDDTFNIDPQTGQIDWGIPKFTEIVDWKEVTKEFNTQRRSDRQDSPEIGSEEYIQQKRREEAQKAQQEELAQIQRAGQLNNRQQENLDIQKQRDEETLRIQNDRTKEDNAYNLERYKERINQQIADTTRQKEAELQRMRKIGWVMGLNVVSTFSESYNDTVNRFNEVINRLSEDRANTEERQWVFDDRIQQDFDRNVDQLLESYEINSKRLQEDFNYQMRDYRENALIEANQLVEELWLSSDKLWERLRDVSLNAFNLVNQAYGSYLDNTRKETDLLYDQANNAVEFRNTLRDQEKQQIDDFLLGSGNKTIVELNEMVARGMISEDQASNAMSQIVQNSIDTIDSYFMDGLGVSFQDQIIEWLNAGKTPNQVLQEIIQSPEFGDTIQQLSETDPFFASKMEQQRLANERSQQVLDQGVIDYEQSQLDLEQSRRENTDWPIPSDNILLHNGTGRYLNEVAIQDFDNAYQELQDAWYGDMVFAQGHRDQTETIKSMAQRHGIPFNASNPNETAEALRQAGHQVANVGNSKHENGMAIDIYANANFDAPTAEQVDILNKNGFYQTAGAWDMGHFDYLGSDNDINTNIFNDSGEVMWDLGVPISYEMSIKNMVPTQLRNWEEERKELNSKIVNFWKAWLSQEDASLAFMWFSVSDSLDKDFALSLVDAVRSLPQPDIEWIMPIIASAVNIWNDTQAIMKAENAVNSYIKNQRWNDYIDESNVSANVRLVNDIKTLISQLDDSPIWSVEWSFEKFLGRFKDVNASKIETLVSELSVDKIANIAWTNITEWEERFFEPLIPSISDRPDVFMSKLDRLVELPIIKLNSQRENYGLPSLTVDMIYDNWNKAMRRSSYSRSNTIARAWWNNKNQSTTTVDWYTADDIRDISNASFTKDEIDALF